MTSCDAVIIGSGAAGLTSACLLAETGRRVVVLERHSVAGGLLQQFRRGGVTFDTGFHYAGGLGEGGTLRRYLRRLGVMDRLTLEPYDPAGFDEVVLPGRRFRFPVGWDNVAAALAHAFPDDAAATSEYLDALQRTLRAYPMYSFGPEAWTAPAIPTDSERTVGAVLAPIGSPDLRAVLSAHTMLYGVPAGRAPLAAHAMAVGSLFHSAHGIRGGGGALASALVERLQELGGEVRQRCSARQIVVDQARVAGVETDDGATIAAPQVIAAVHPAIALGLLGEAAVPRRIASRVRSLRNGYSALLVHGVVRNAPGARRNWLWFESPAAACSEIGPWFDAGLRPPCAAVLTGSSVPGSLRADVFHLFCPVLRSDADPASPHRPWRDRKEAAARRAVEVLEECVPEWRGRYEILDMSGPGAIERFVASPGGAAYGAECSIEQAGVRRSLTHMGIDGVRLAGQSVGLPGVLGAVVSAFVAVGGLTGDAARLYGELRRSGGSC